MSVEEVRVRRVDVARLHRHHIRPTLRCYRHGHLGEVHNYAVENFTQHRISTERLLKYPQSQKTVQA